MLRWRQGLLGALLLCGLAAARTVSHPAAFIYVYPLPTYYHTGASRALCVWEAGLHGSLKQPAHAGMSRYNRAFEDPTYDADREMMDYWLSSDLVTPDPCNATLFFVPIFTADFVQVRGVLTRLMCCCGLGRTCAWAQAAACVSSAQLAHCKSQVSRLLRAQDPSRGSAQAIAFGGDLRRQWRLRESTPDCEGCDAADSQSVLANRLTYFTNSAMDLVRELPYWHRSQGADHFWLPTADFSRCYGAPPGVQTLHLF